MKNISILFLIFAFISCTSNKSNNDLIDEDKLGIIDADVKSEETNFKEKAKYNVVIPGSGAKVERAFENAPPLIPHTTQGFFPIKIDQNICLSCHMPEEAKTTGAISLPETHFMDLRPQPVEENGEYTIKGNETLIVKHKEKLNNSYFNCSQCHVPLTNVQVDIENLFTPEFREKFGLEKSNLDKTIDEGI